MRAKLGQQEKEFFKLYGNFYKKPFICKRIDLKIKKSKIAVHFYNILLKYRLFAKCYASFQDCSEEIASLVQ